MSDLEKTTHPANKPITVRIDHPELSSGKIQGFRYFWAFYVNGFRQTTHCQPCFRGSPSVQLNTVSAESGRLYVMDERAASKYLYLCGVGVGPRDLLYRKNFHLALSPCDDHEEVRETYNGYTVVVQNAIALPIPELPEGWNGLDRETTRCKNFRFAVAQFGWCEPAARFVEQATTAPACAATTKIV
jgi:hypothetical protein